MPRLGALDEYGRAWKYPGRSAMITVIHQDYLINSL